MSAQTKAPLCGLRKSIRVRLALPTLCQSSFGPTECYSYEFLLTCQEDFNKYGKGK